MADALVVRPRMRCQGHVAHGISRLHHSVRSLCDTQPRAFGPRCVNRVETSTS